MQKVQEKETKSSTVEERLTEYADSISKYGLGEAIEEYEKVKSDYVGFNNQNTSLTRAATEAKKAIQDGLASIELIRKGISVNSRATAESKLEEQLERAENEGRGLLVQYQEEYMEKQREKEEHVNSLTEADVIEAIKSEADDLLELEEFADEVDTFFSNEFGAETMAVMKHKIDNRNGIETFSTEGVMKLKDNYYQVRDALVDKVNKEEVDYSKFVDTILLSPSALTKDPSKQVLAYSGYLAVLAVAMYLFRFLAVGLVAVYLITILYKAYQRYHYTRELVQVYTRFRYASLAVAYYRDNFENNLGNRLAIAKQELAEQYDELLEEISQDVALAQSQLDAKLAEVRANFDMEYEVEQARIPFEKQIEDLEASIEQARGLLTGKKDSIVELQRTKELFLKKIEYLRDRIEQLATSLNVLSRNKALLAKFYLGFDDGQNPLYFDWNKETKVVFYEDSMKDEVKAMITMMVTQIMKSTNISTLNMRLVDMKNSGTDYSVFIPRKVGENTYPDNLYKIVSDATSMGDTIKEFEDQMKVVRERALSKYVGGIHEFNQEMIATKSGTLEYFITFMVDYEPSVFKNLTFQQVLTNSYKYGIIPIVFVNYNLVKYLEAKTPEEQTRMKPYFDKDYGELLRTVPLDSFYAITEKDGLVRKNYTQDVINKLVMNIEKANK